MGERYRYCVAPEDAAAPNGSDLFEALTEDGVCFMNSGVIKHVTVWTLAGALERARAAFGQKETRPARKSKPGRRRRVRH